MLRFQGYEVQKFDFDNLIYGFFEDFFGLRSYFV
jgi:hypothetical protein